MKKGIIASRLMYSIIITLILVNIYIKTPNGKLILLPFLIWDNASKIKSNLSLLPFPGEPA